MSVMAQQGGRAEGGRSARTHDGAARVRLLELQGDLAAHIDPDHLDAARASVTVPAVSLPPGPWEPSTAGSAARQPFATIVLSGLIARTVDIGNHPGLELYGPGDVIGGSALSESVLPAGESWTVTTPSRIAVLDDEFLVATRRWPRLVTGVCDQMQRQRDRLVLQLVIAEQPRVEDRLLALFWLLSEQYGHVCSDGVVVGLRLTHEALGRLIGAQRPTVTLALKALRARDSLERRADGSWLLNHQPGEAIVDAAPLPASHAPVPVAACPGAEIPVAAGAGLKRAAQASLRR